jgi:hypothetical protein
MERELALVDDAQSAPEPRRSGEVNGALRARAD